MYVQGRERDLRLCFNDIPRYQRRFLGMEIYKFHLKDREFLLTFACRRAAKKCKETHDSLLYLETDALHFSAWNRVKSPRLCVCCCLPPSPSRCSTVLDHWSFSHVYYSNTRVNKFSYPVFTFGIVCLPLFASLLLLELLQKVESGHIINKTGFVFLWGLGVFLVVGRNQTWETRPQSLPPSQVLSEYSIVYQLLKSLWTVGFAGGQCPTKIPVWLAWRTKNWWRWPLDHISTLADHGPYINRQAPPLHHPSHF